MSDFVGVDRWDDSATGTNIVFHGVVNEVREGKGGGYAMPTVGQGGILGARRRGIRFNDREMVKLSFEL